MAALSRPGCDWAFGNRVSLPLLVVVPAEGGEILDGVAGCAFSGREATRLAFSMGSWRCRYSSVRAFSASSRVTADFFCWDRRSFTRFNACLDVRIIAATHCDLEAYV